MNIQTDSSEKDGLPKEMEFNQVNQGFISSVASKRNHIPRKSLNYQTPLEVFELRKWKVLSRLI
jgi:IS30 family transposase